MLHTHATQPQLTAGLVAGQVLQDNGPAFEVTELIARALDWLSCGVVIVDEDIRPIFANRAGHALIDKGRFPLLRKATLYRPDPLEGIRRAIAAFRDTYATVSCRVGNPPLICTVANLQQSCANRRGRAVLFVTDPKQMRTTRLADVAGLGLTRAEAALAVEFANGHSLQTCADRLGISLTTTRTHLRRIFEKTGACRQAELMRLILTSTPALRHACED
jgi:DNA-binding CsgD family transcriptional regulator